MITIELSKEDEDYAKRIIELAEESTGIIYPSSFTGLDDIIIIGVSFATAAVTGLTKIIIELIRRNKKVRIKVGDIEIDGINEKNAHAELEKLIKISQQKNNKGNKNAKK